MSTLERLQNILIKEYKLSREALAADAQLESLGVDSPGMLELFFDVEDEFAIKVPNDPLVLKTIGEVVVYIDQLVTQQHSDIAATQ